MDFKQSRRALDAGVAERIFTFSFDILDNWEEKGNLHNFEARMKLRSTVFFKGAAGGLAILKPGLNQHFKVSAELFTSESDHRAADWQGLIYMVLKQTATSSCRELGEEGGSIKYTL